MPALPSVSANEADHCAHVTCRSGLRQSAAKLHSRIRDAISRQEGSGSSISRSKPRAQCPSLWNGEDGSVRIDNKPIGEGGSRQASPLLADTQGASLRD